MSVAASVRATIETAEPSSLSARGGLLQRKLHVGASNDPLELEADRVANQVLAAPVTPAANRSAPLVRRGLDHENESTEAVPANVERALAGPGTPLEPKLREDMEQRFGHDFSRVRVHSGAAATRSAADINAHAYTLGHHIVFGAQQYLPDSFTGKRLLAHELAHVVQQSPVGPFATGASAHAHGRPIDSARTSAGFGAVRRQVAATPGAKHEATRTIVRVERYWHSTSARVIFEDGSTEEVTFIDGSGIDTPSAPDQRYTKVIDATIDRTSPIRPRLEIAFHGKGSRVKVETRLAPADRIARLPVNARRQVAGAYLNDTDNDSDPRLMEFIADMGDRLSESSGAMAISMEGRDPATVSKMEAVEQWIVGQQKTLDQVGGARRGKFNQLLKDIRQIGVTGPVASDDLDAQDIELVLAGVAGGQSDFQAYAEFKRVFQWNVRAGNKSLSQDAVDNPEFFIRNEYRRVWKAEADGLRKLSRIAAAAQVAPFILIGGSAVIGAAPVALGAFGTSMFASAAARGISAKLLTTWVGSSLLATSGIEHLVGAWDEAKAAGMDTGSPLNFANILSTAALRTFGVGSVAENASDESILTRQSLGRSPLERIVGIVQGTADAFGAASMMVPEAPTVAKPVAATGPPVAEPVAAPAPPAASTPAPASFPKVMQGGGERTGKPTGMLRDTDSASRGVKVDAVPSGGSMGDAGGKSPPQRGSDKKRSFGGAFFGKPRKEVVPIADPRGTRHTGVTATTPPHRPWFDKKTDPVRPVPAFQKWQQQQTKLPAGIAGESGVAEGYDGAVKRSGKAKPGKRSGKTDTDGGGTDSVSPRRLRKGPAPPVRPAVKNLVPEPYPLLPRGPRNYSNDEQLAFYSGERGRYPKQIQQMIDDIPVGGRVKTAQRRQFEAIDRAIRDLNTEYHNRHVVGDSPDKPFVQSKRAYGTEGDRFNAALTGNKTLNLTGQTRSGERVEFDSVRLDEHRLIETKMNLSSYTTSGGVMDQMRRQATFAKDYGFSQVLWEVYDHESFLTARYAHKELSELNPELGSRIDVVNPSDAHR